jgi:hypothetical protein
LKFEKNADRENAKVEIDEGRWTSTQIEKDFVLTNLAAPGVAIGRE